MSKIGFIGLGIMGKPMSLNLLEKGHSLVVYDVAPYRVADIVASGATRGESCADVAANADVVITMLPDGPDVEAAMFGPEGVLAGTRQGTVVVDMSSVSPVVSIKVGAACEAIGVDFLDAPVSGGEPRAINGTLAIMVGGRSDVFDRVLPILNALGLHVTLTGSAGAGNFTKLANQIMVACNIAAMGEALVLATRAGLDPSMVLKAIQDGLAGSNVLDAKAPMVISRNFAPGFRIGLHQKDLRNALLAAESMKVSLPFTSLVHQILVALVNDGKGHLDHAAIVTFFERMAGVEVRSESAAAAP